MRVQRILSRIKSIVGVSFFPKIRIQFLHEAVCEFKLSLAYLEGRRWGYWQRVVAPLVLLYTCQRRWPGRRGLQWGRQTWSEPCVLRPTPTVNNGINKFTQALFITCDGIISATVLVTSLYYLWRNHPYGRQWIINELNINNPINKLLHRSIVYMIYRNCA